MDLHLLAVVAATVTTGLQLLAVLNVVVSLLLPLVQQAITHSQASDQVKVLVTAGLSAVVGTLTPYLSGTTAWGSFNWQITLISVGTMFFQTVMAHYGLWKPLSVTGIPGLISSLTSNFGFGAPTATPAVSGPVDTGFPAVTGAPAVVSPTTTSSATTTNVTVVTPDPAPVDPASGA